MYRINYSYYEHDENNRITPKHKRFTGYVDGDTIEQVNKSFADVRYNHNLFKYTMLIFDSIEKIKKNS